MFRRFTKKRTLTVLGGGALAVLGAVAAFAFFTSSGNGSGSATVGSAGSWNFSVASATGTLYPDPASGGTNIATEAYTVTNGGQGNQYLTNVQYSVPSTYSATDSNGDPACTASSFRLGPSSNSTGAAATDAYTTDLAAGGTVTGKATIEMIDNNGNQNACQGVTVPLSFSAR
jgi:hypothetical protein